MKNTYRAHVLVGNWYETREQALQQHQSTDSHAEESGRTRSQSKLEATTKQVSLSPSEDGLIHFGDIVSIVSENTKLPLCSDESETAFGDDLSYAVTTSTQSIQPCLRNAFVILDYNDLTEKESEENESESEPILKYGDKFVISSHPNAKPFFIASTRKTVTLFAKKSKEQPVYTCEKLSFDCCWTVLHSNTSMRLEYEGTPVRVNERIVIAHTPTNNCLASTNTFKSGSDFGLEYEVFAKTFATQFKTENIENHWHFEMGKLEEK